ncbi:MAG: hypothetical protein M5U34_40605 [Chloroflexi bacterium]|nr:hypothetical protein [Chloroflexota bacterium]
MMPMKPSTSNMTPGLNMMFEHTHVVGGPGHDVADALAAVKGLVFAQQADVEFVAGASPCCATTSLDQLGDRPIVA